MERRKTVISMSKAVSAMCMHVTGPKSELVPTDVSDVNVLCPECAKLHNSCRLTFNINFEKNVCYCPRCGFGGGTYDLISAITKWPLDTVESHVMKGDLNGFIPSENSSADDDEYIKVRPLAPLSLRDEVYRAMLDLLTLNKEHNQNLRNRGLPQEYIDKIGFKSYPRFMDTTVIAKKLITKGLDLKGVPGFGINKDGNWEMQKMPSGFLIPNRNGRGLIQGFQIRHDHPSDKLGKYGYFTSGKMEGGTPCGTWCCWAGIDYETMQKKSPFDVILIEGPLKAYIVNALTGANVISVPGVAALVKVPPALQSMATMGLSKVFIAYDMDAEKNEKVNKQLNRLRSILDGIGIQHSTMQWNREYKGLDDWIASPEFNAC